MVDQIERALRVMAASPAPSSAILSAPPRYTDKW